MNYDRILVLFNIMTRFLWESVDGLYEELIKRDGIAIKLPKLGSKRKTYFFLKCQTFNLQYLYRSSQSQIIYHFKN